MIDGLLRGAPGGPPGDLVLLMNVSALATRGPPGGPRGAPAAGFLPGGPFLILCLFGAGVISFVFHSVSYPFHTENSILQH